MTFRTLAPLLVAGGIALTACGGGSSSSSATLPADADVTIKAVDGIRWNKDAVTADAGDVTIAAVNDSSVPHNLHIVQADGTQLPNVLDLSEKGKVQTETVQLTAGTYTLICTVPGHSNMKATLTVK